MSILYRISVYYTFGTQLLCVASKGLIQLANENRVDFSGGVRKETVPQMSSFHSTVSSGAVQGRAKFSTHAPFKLLNLLLHSSCGVFQTFTDILKYCNIWQHSGMDPD